MSLAQRMVAGVLSVVAAASLAACSAPAVSETPEAKQDALRAGAALGAARTVHLKKSALSLGDHWEVMADGAKVATIEGRVLKMGEVYAVLSPGGGLLGSEEQQIFTLARTARFFDHENRETAVLSKDLLTFMAMYRLKRGEQQVASLETKFALTLQGDIRGEQGQVCWSFKRKAFSWGSDITMTRKNSCVLTLDAVRMVAVASEVYDTQQN